MKMTSYFWLRSGQIEVKDGTAFCALHVNTHHPLFWLWAAGGAFRAWFYNLGFSIVHRHDDHVRVWQNGERCSGCENRDGECSGQ